MHGDLVAFVPSCDLEAAARFYGPVLGLALIESTEFALVYDAGPTRLRVTRVDVPARAPYTVLGWHVASIADTMAELRCAGVEFTRYDGMTQDSDGVWIAPSGARIAWFTDPDGNVLSLQQDPLR